MRISEYEKVIIKLQQPNMDIASVVEKWERTTCQINVQFAELRFTMATFEGACYGYEFNAYCYKIPKETCVMKISEDDIKSIKEALGKRSRRKQISVKEWVTAKLPRWARSTFSGEGDAKQN